MLEAAKAPNGVEPNADGVSLANTRPKVNRLNTKHVNIK